jgi:hypothetical protein
MEGGHVGNAGAFSGHADEIPCTFMVKALTKCHLPTLFLASTSISFSAF